MLYERMGVSRRSVREWESVGTGMCKSSNFALCIRPLNQDDVSTQTRENTV